MSPKNVVLFGQTGAGKSSVVNLIAGEERAKASPDMVHCTLEWEEHLISINGYDSQVFDTVGLSHPNLRKDEYLDAIVNAHKLVERLHHEGGINLLLFCMRAGKVTSTVQRNYRLFYEWLCEKKVPVVIVLTGLEGEQRMEDWWDRNKLVFAQYDIQVAGHACITAADNLEGRREQQLYEESRDLVRDLIFQHTHGMQGGTYTEVGAYNSVMQKLAELALGNFEFTPKKRDIMTVLTKRCGMPSEAARELASRIRSELAGKSP